MPLLLILILFSQAQAAAVPEIAPAYLADKSWYDKQISLVETAEISEARRAMRRVFKALRTASRLNTLLLVQLDKTPDGPVASTIETRRELLRQAYGSNDLFMLFATEQSAYNLVRSLAKAGPATLRKRIKELTTDCWQGLGRVTYTTADTYLRPPLPFRMPSAVDWVVHRYQKASAEAVTDGVWPGRRLLLRLLTGQLPNVPISPSLRKACLVLSRDSDILLSAEAVEALWPARDPAAEDVIRKALSSPHAQVRYAAVSAIYAGRKRQFLKDAIPLLDDPIRQIGDLTYMCIRELNVPEGNRELTRRAKFSERWIHLPSPIDVTLRKRTIPEADASAQDRILHFRRILHPSRSIQNLQPDNVASFVVIQDHARLVLVALKNWSHREADSEDINFGVIGYFHGLFQ